MSQFSEGDAAITRLTAATDAFEKVLTEPEGTIVPMPVGQPQPSLAERLKRALDAVTVQPAQAAAQATASAQQASQSAAAAAQSAADASNSAAATGYVDAPFPDVWAPLSDSLQLLAGSAPADTLTIGGTSYPLPTKSVSFSRATTATYIDKSGVLQTAAINEPRFEKEGLLVEGQSTNYFLYSNNPSNWIGIDPTLNKTFGPMGNTQAPTGSFVVGTAKVDAQVHQSNSLNLTAGQSITISCRVKGTVGMLRIRIAKSGTFYTAADVNLATGQVTTSVSVPMQSSSFLDSDGFYNITAALDITSDDIYVAQLRLRETTSDSNMTVGATLDIQMPQIEIGKFRTSFIITDASTATRAADDCTLQRSGNDNYFGPVTIAAEVHCNGQTIIDGTTANRRGIFTAYPSAGEYVIAMISSSPGTAGQLSFAYAGSDFLSGGVRIDDNNSHVIAMRANTSQRHVCVDGAMSAPAAITRPTPGTVSAANQIIMVGRGAGAQAPGQRMLNGHIRNLRIWHRALSDIQIKGLR